MKIIFNCKYYVKPFDYIVRIVRRYLFTLSTLSIKGVTAECCIMLFFKKIISKSYPTATSWDRPATS